MNRRAKRNGVARARRASVAVLLVGLLLCPALWPPCSLAQSAADRAEIIRGQDGSVTVAGFRVKPGFVDPSPWQKDKSVLVKFSLEREDKNSFIKLDVRVVKAELNAEPVELVPDSLKLNNDPIKVLFIIDKSGSMEMDSAGYSVNKLAAAKESLHYFVDNLDPDAQVAIRSFDLESHPVVDLTDDKDRLKAGIDSISSGGGTSIYGSLNEGLEIARQQGIKDIVFLSDGKDDQGRGKPALSQDQKTENELSISQRARDLDVSIFTIAIGEPGADDERSVDSATLENISTHTKVGFNRTIKISDLIQETGGDPALLEDSLTKKLKDVLTEIKKYLEFNYTQSVVLPDLQKGEGELKLEVTVDKGDERVSFPVDYYYEWGKNDSLPKFRPGEILFGLINTKPIVGWAGLTRIYLWLLSALLLLALLPSGINQVATAREMGRMRHAVVVIGRGSPLQGNQCPNEMGAGGRRYLFREGDAVLVCPKCNTPHHLSCWEYNQHRCMNRLCEYQFQIPARLLDKYKLAPGTKQRFV